MPTPFVAFLPPTRLDGYRIGVPADMLPPHIPSVFVDAMEVRTKVFVVEQNIPPECELDTDDPRSCHWVAYASIHSSQPELRSTDGTLLRPHTSETRSTPIGTIRAVPFPHQPHPQPGARYVGGIRVPDDPGTDGAAPAATSVPSAPIIPNRLFSSDRATELHDGTEAYIKLGRMAVIKEFRNQQIAGLLVRIITSWLREHPAYFDPSVAQLGLEKLGAASASDIPEWKGLVCVHAQESVVKFWQRFGFRVDAGMGKWWEEGIPHVGMFARLDLPPKPIKI